MSESVNHDLRALSSSDMTHALKGRSAVDILFVTIGYPPDQVGGTEVYVQGLAETLAERGWKVAILCLDDFADQDEPVMRMRTNEHNGITVHRIGLNNAKANFSRINFDSQLKELFLNEFLNVLKLLKPAILHVHPLRLFLFTEVILAAKELEIPTAFTFHSSTTTCARGDMLYFGTQDCNGKIVQQRCSACMMNKLGMPSVLASILSTFPKQFWALAHSISSNVGALRKVASLSSVPLSIDALGKSWNVCTTNSKVVVAVCDWVRATTELNGVPEAKVIKSRHGLRIESKKTERASEAKPVFGYLGRCGPEKGTSCLVRAVASLPKSIEFVLEICSATLTKEFLRPEEAEEVRLIRELAAQDSRVRLLAGIPDEELGRTLSEWDALIVPSLWFESGPQTIYEAFAVQTPVIGSNRGGVAELVTHGETGFLYPPGDHVALAAIIKENAEDIKRLRNMRHSIPPQRHVADLTNDMEVIYRSLLAKGESH